MERVDYVICGDYVLTMNDKMDVIREGAVAVRGTKIVDVDTEAALLNKYAPGTLLKDKDRAVLPGLINTHTHAAMAYFRGLGDDLPLKDWLEDHIWPAEGKWLSPEFVSDAVELACLEMLKGGVTTYSDMYFFGDSAARATKKIGMRAFLGAGVVDFPTASGKNADDYLKNAERFINDWQGDGLITPCIAAHSAYACSPETLKKIIATTDSLHTQRHIHLSETEWEVGEMLSKYGKRPAVYLSGVGFLNENALAAHCVWLDDEEIEILAMRKTGVAHCIESNLKLASGIAPVPAMLRAGVRVSFGTDGAASNNDLNILSEMSTAAKVHKAISKDPTVLDSKTALLMATRWGADVLGLGDRVGSIENGKAADIITINLKKPHMMPLYDIYSHIVYAAMASDVENVIVNGKQVLNNRNLITADENEILEKAAEWGKKISGINP